MAMFNVGDEDAERRKAEFFGPEQVDRMVRQAIQFCWIGLAKDHRSVEEVETQVRRIVERALRDFREDRRAFGASIIREPDPE